MQLHELKGNFNTGKASLSRRSELGQDAFTLNIDDNGYIIEAILNDVNGHVTLDDFNILEGIVEGSIQYLTTSQLLAADLSDDGSIDGYDLNIVSLMISDTSLALGDINNDGNINVSDIVAIVNYIIGTPNETTYDVAADMNEDGVVNITDIVSLVNQIIT